MAIAFVVKAGRRTPGATTGVDTTGANFLVCMIGGEINATAPTDSKGNTWTQVRDENGEFSGEVALFYCENPTVGSGHTWTTTSSLCCVSVAAFSGVATSSSLDQQNGVSNDDEPYNAGSITPSEDNELVIAAMGGGVQTGHAIDGGFTITDAWDTTGGVNYDGALAYLIQTTATAANPSWTGSGTGPLEGVINASFKADAGGGGGGFQSAWARGSNSIIQPGLR